MGGLILVARLFAGALFLVAAAGVEPDLEWGTYSNARYQYSLDIPPGFSRIREAENRDGGTSRTLDGSARLAVWGANLLGKPFRDEVGDRIAGDAAEGWDLSYKRVTGEAASWSGTREGRILYARAIPLCGDAAGFFRIEYEKAHRQAFDEIVEGLVESFRSTC
jgi:hypothetical protein